MQRRYLAAEISKRIKLPTPAADALLSIANHPMHRVELGPRERKAQIDRLRFQAETILDLPPEANMLNKVGIANTLCLAEILLGLVQRTID